MRDDLELYLTENRIDVVIIGMDFFWSDIIYEACKNANAKTIYVLHEPKPHPNEPFLISYLKQKTLPKAIQGTDHLVTLTSHVKKHVMEKFERDESSVSVIPHGIFSYYQSADHKALPVNEPVNLLYFGRIEYYKGLDILLDAFKIIEDKGLNVNLEIWGSGKLSDYRNQIDALRNIKVENRWISENEIPDIFKRAHVCILPYRDASQSGIVGTAAESATPIVACPSVGLKEQLKDAGALLSDDFTPEALAMAILEVIQNGSYYTELSKKNLEYSKSISWYSIAADFEKLMNKLLHN